MINEILQIFREQNVLVHNNSGIAVCTVADSRKGFELAGEILSRIVDRKSVLYLSGGRTPKDFYARIAHEERLKPGAVGLVDERYGPRFHEKSNEKMIKDTGILRYLEILDIPFYPILQSPQPPLSKGGAEGGGFIKRAEIAKMYDEKIRFLHSTFQKHIGILGVGNDGHTAGLPAVGQSLKLKVKSLELFNSQELVTEYNDTRGKYGERVTMTFLGLSMLDVLLVLVFGPAKRDAMELVFSEGSEEEIPGRFYKRSEIAKKTVFITDQT